MELFEHLKEEFVVLLQELREASGSNQWAKYQVILKDTRSRLDCLYLQADSKKRREIYQNCRSQLALVQASSYVQRPKIFRQAPHSLLQKQARSPPQNNKLLSLQDRYAIQLDLRQAQLKQHEVANRLQLQGQQLDRGLQHNREIDRNLQREDELLESIGRSMQRNRWILLISLGMTVISLALMLYKKLFK